MIVIVDFGSQTTHLIGRRIRELGVEAKIIESEKALEEVTSHIRSKSIKGIILSGGPASVYEKSSPTIDKKVFELGIPILGICYGQQLIGYLLDGEVKPGKASEYGPAKIIDYDKNSPLFKSFPSNATVWMSHGDEVVRPPTGFRTTAGTATIEHAAIENPGLDIYAIQFHPEVIHTQGGDQVLKNFLEICGLKTKKIEIDREFVNNMVADIKDSIGREKAICALSGGVDSSVAAVLVHQAIGDNLQAVYIDSGLMREDETKFLKEVFGKEYQMKVKQVFSKEKFLQKIKGVVDPEEKRIIIGNTFIEVFDEEAKKIGASFFVQGTIYPDVIESAGTPHAQKIKTHHNVGGLPGEIPFALVEPLRNFYKDEVRTIGQILGLPSSIINRQPFPGPGLAVRIIGEVTERKLEILRRADKIVQEEIEKAGFKDQLWQYFAVFTGIKTTGVRGDAKVYGETIAIRAIEAKDAMSADFAKLPWDLLQRISNRIVTEIKQVNRVVYDITTKPPATMEWE